MKITCRNSDLCSPVRLRGGSEIRSTCGSAGLPHSKKRCPPLTMARCPEHGKPASPQDAALKGKWWEIFNEPELNALEEQLNIDNQNIAQFFQNFMAAPRYCERSPCRPFPPP